MKITIYWLRATLEGRTAQETISLICDKLSLPKGMNINRETSVNVSEDIFKRLQEAEKQGFIKIRIK
ncbi:MAG: hypothetical protein LUI85_02725 [Bacteroides sp.]|nr:hypothetical protein [Bacteroides sp.]